MKKITIPVHLMRDYIKQHASNFLSPVKQFRDEFLIVLPFTKGKPGAIDLVTNAVITRSISEYM